MEAIKQALQTRTQLVITDEMSERFTLGEVLCAYNLLKHRRISVEWNTSLFSHDDDNLGSCRGITIYPSNADYTINQLLLYWLLNGDEEALLSVEDEEEEDLFMTSKQFDSQLFVLLVMRFRLLQDKTILRFAELMSIKLDNGYKKINDAFDEYMNDN